LEFEMYSTNFHGQGSRGPSEVATSASQKQVILSAGVDYLL